ncbi:MAG: zinc ribbon domain-containing protein [Nanoarchaeota archaeon]
MTKIHGIVYVIIGVAVALYSYKVNPTKLILFMYAGIIFSIWGLIRIFIDRAKKPKVHKHHQQRSMPHPQAPIHQQGSPVAKFCHRCGTTLHNFQNFCHNCGERLTHHK